MHYKEALQKVIDAQNHVWGGFYEDLPDLKGLDVLKKQEVLKERGRTMKKQFDTNQIAFFEVVRFSQELDTILLLLVICMWGAAREEVPATDTDIMSVKSAMRNLCVAGVSESDGIMDLVKKLLAEGMKSHVLPPSTLSLLPSLYPIEIGQ